MVYVAASSYGYGAGEELEGDYFEDGEEAFAGLGDWKGVFGPLLDVGVAFDSDAAIRTGHPDLWLS